MSKKVSGTVCVNVADSVPDTFSAFGVYASTNCRLLIEKGDLCSVPRSSILNLHPLSLFVHGHGSSCEQDREELAIRW